jgi:hypothetical protein
MTSSSNITAQAAITATNAESNARSFLGSIRLFSKYTSYSTQLPIAALWITTRSQWIGQFPTLNLRRLLSTRH